MSEELELLLAERAIERQLKNYCRSMDRCDLALGQAVFHPDASADYGTMFQGTGRDFVAFAMTAHLRFEVHLHRLTNAIITVEGPRAASESYVDAQFRTIEDGAPFDTYTRGRYLDRWEKRDGVWAIASRRYVNAMSGKRPIAVIPYGCEGSRDGGDPSYAVFDLVGAD